MIKIINEYLLIKLTKSIGFIANTINTVNYNNLLLFITENFELIIFLFISTIFIFTLIRFILLPLLSQHIKIHKDFEFEEYLANYSNKVAKYKLKKLLDLLEEELEANSYYSIDLSYIISNDYCKNNFIDYLTRYKLEAYIDYCFLLWASFFLPLFSLYIVHASPFYSLIFVFLIKFESYSIKFKKIIGYELLLILVKLI